MARHRALTEVVWRRLISIVDEADTTVARTAFSSLIRDSHDYTCAVFDPTGRLLAQASFTTPGQLGGMTRGIPRIIEQLGVEPVSPGDVWITNDPWLLAGHLPDVLALSPVFHCDRVVAWAASVFHHADIGGRLGLDNREIYEEGLFVPLVKLWGAGRENQALLRTLLANVRLPDMTAGDLTSQLSANHIVERRLHDLLEREGLASLDALAEEIMARSEASMRRAIQRLRPGTYCAEYPIESPAGDDIVLRVAVTVDKDEIVVDFDGTTPQVGMGLNCVLNFSFAYSFFAVKSALDPTTPNNDGCVRPVVVRAPEGSILNPVYPAAVNGRTAVGHYLSDVVFQALAPVLPDRVVAGAGSAPSWWKVMHWRDHSGVARSKATLFSGGIGASAEGDGAACTPFPHNCFNEPVEVLETEAPMLCREKSLVPDSGGAGQWRGGLGQVMEFDVLRGGRGPAGPVTIALVAGRFRRPAPGIVGGGSGSLGGVLHNGEARFWGRAFQVQPGDRVRFLYPGGGGYGDPMTRDLDRVEADLTDGYVTAEAARRDYCAVLRPGTHMLDRDASTERRLLSRTGRQPPSRLTDAGKLD